MSTESKEARRLLRSQGKRVTPRRLLLFEVMQEHGGHLDADELYLLAKKREPRLSLSTVYRTLSLLKELDLIEELHFDEEHHHYEIKGRETEHHHLICLNCGEIIEFENPLIGNIKAQVAQDHHFRVTGVHIDLRGYCQRCVKQVDRMDIENGSPERGPNLWRG